MKKVNITYSQNALIAAANHSKVKCFFGKHIWGTLKKLDMNHNNLVLRSSYNEGDYDWFCLKCRKEFNEFSKNENKKLEKIQDDQKNVKISIKNLSDIFTFSDEIS